MRTLLVAGSVLAMGIAAARAAGDGGLKVTVYIVWGSDAGKDRKLPAELEKYAESIRKASQKAHLRLEAKPRTLSLEPGKPVKVRLPDKTEIEWTLGRDGDKVVVTQALRRPSGEKTVIQLRDVAEKPEPRINVVSRGADTLMVVARFDAGAKE